MTNQENSQACDHSEEVWYTVVMKIIELSQDQVTKVNDTDYEMLLAGPKWSASWSPHTQTFYALRSIYRSPDDRTTEKMSRVILGITDPSIHVDHKNLDTLDNQRSNLRVSTPSQNVMNRRSQRGSSSQYKGVSWYTPYNKWRAQIMFEGKYRFLGYFHDEIEAAKAYDVAAVMYFGEFAKPNFPLPPTLNRL